MFQALRKKFLSPDDLALITLIEGAKEIRKNESTHYETVEYKIDLACSRMVVDREAMTAVLTCKDSYSKVNISKRFIACVAYLWQKDYDRREYVRRVNEEARKVVDIAAFVECATNCEEKK